MTKKKAAAKAAPKKTKTVLAKPERRTIPCRICKAKVEFTSGLDEMADHWEVEHPEAYAKLRASLGHDEEA